jgi:hypothetical protein
MRVLRNILIAVFAVYLALLGGLLAVMHRPILFGQVMKHVPGPAFMVIPFKTLWFSARGGQLKVGDQAPDFSLMTPDKSARVDLASFRGRKPVVLVFGSYT